MRNARLPGGDGKTGEEGSSQLELFPSVASTAPVVNDSEIPKCYQSAAKRIRSDRDLYPLFRKVALFEIHKRGTISADEIEHEMKSRYGGEGLAFCHYTRTFMGLLFRFENPALADKLRSKPGKLKTVPACVLRGILNEVERDES